jgi:hypothetical protein
MEWEVTVWDAVERIRHAYLQKEAGKSLIIDANDLAEY